MQLPPKHVNLAGLLASALSSANEAMARTAAQAREWLLEPDEDQVRLALGGLTEAEFASKGPDLLGSWGVQTVLGPVAELESILQAAGFDPGRRSCGTCATGTGCLGRFISIEVHDPMLGDFVARLWLLADWETGLELLLGAYRPISPADATHHPADVEPGALALVSLAKTPIDWAGLTLAEARTEIWQWQQSMLAPNAAGNVVKHWPSLLSALEAEMAP